MLSLPCLFSILLKEVCVWDLIPHNSASVSLPFKQSGAKCYGPWPLSSRHACAVWGTRSYDHFLWCFGSTGLLFCILYCLLHYGPLLRSTTHIYMKEMTLKWIWISSACYEYESQDSPAYWPVSTWCLRLFFFSFACILGLPWSPTSTRGWLWPSCESTG